MWLDRFSYSYFSCYWIWDRFEMAYWVKTTAFENADPERWQPEAEAQRWILMSTHMRLFSALNTFLCSMQEQWIPWESVHRCNGQGQPLLYIPTTVVPNSICSTKGGILISTEKVVDNQEWGDKFSAIMMSMFPARRQKQLVPDISVITSPFSFRCPFVFAPLCTTLSGHLSCCL